ncbi:Venom allergen 3 [Papilio xuthus]|uniref:Venom allergen 3 n=1 Tax=Papilio xuthus TaxID=66420 RepID=A0A194Q0U0_PAPXU|nr:Venom allergen 3 [Papilio xuthus]
MNENNFSSKPILDIFNEYEYIYDDERYQTRYGEFMPKEKEVPLSGQKENPRIYYSTNDTRKMKKNKSNLVKLKLLDYYTLEPAAAYVHIEDDKYTQENGSVWYVPQDIPCWELPVLYGELGRKEKISEVFSIHRGYLKNVLRQNKIKKESRKNGYTLGTQMFNKWCGIEPCYGDHTLCLFPDKTISIFCEKGYTVKTPTISEQIALVNTVNSMRNRIAAGESIRYSHLPQAANMMQITYDFDLEKMAQAWLSQCLPGPAPCSALEGNYVSELECMKYMQKCCLNSYNTDTNCTPSPECFVLAVVGCIHAWYWNAGENLSDTDIQCGHIEPTTFNTVQLIWANSHKIGCAFGVSRNGDVRVVCNFSPGAPYFLKRKFFCGLLPHRDITSALDATVDFTNLTFLSSIGIHLDEINETNTNYDSKVHVFDERLLAEINTVQKTASHWGVHSLSNIYQEGWVSRLLDKLQNGTKGMVARVVTQFTFFEESEARCDTEEPVYVKGEPASLCVERGRRYPALCYHFGDPTPGYRLVAIIAPITLFSLILYDLFSGARTQRKSSNVNNFPRFATFATDASVLLRNVI